MTFGHIIRAARLGWYAAPSMQAWLRIADTSEDGRVLAELSPLNEIPPGQTATKGYRCIGFGENGGGTHANPEIIALSPVLSAIKQVKRHVRVVLNDDGTLA